MTCPILSLRCEIASQPCPPSCSARTWRAAAQEVARPRAPRRRAATPPRLRPRSSRRRRCFRAEGARARACNRSGSRCPCSPSRCGVGGRPRSRPAQPLAVTHPDAPRFVDVQPEDRPGAEPPPIQVHELEPVVTDHRRDRLLDQGYPFRVVHRHSASSIANLYGAPRPAGPSPRRPAARPAPIPSRQN